MSRWECLDPAHSGRSLSAVRLIASGARSCAATALLAALYAGRESGFQWLSAIHADLTLIVRICVIN